MRVQTRLEMCGVVHFVLILLSLILLQSFIVYSEEIASGEENKNKNGESFCETSYENRNVWKSNMSNAKQVLQCNSTQPINWIIHINDNLKASIGKEEELPFKIETKLVTCKTPAPPNSNSNSTITTTRTIPYYFTSTLTPTTTITLSKSADPIKMYFFCGNLAFTSPDSFPWACTVFETDGKTSKCSGSSSRKPTITGTPKPNCAQLVMAHDHSSGTCACNGKEESYSFLPCKDLTSCRLLAEAKHDTLCEAGEVRNLCNITSVCLPDSKERQGGILYCKLPTRTLSPYVVFLDIPQRSVIQSMTPCKGESRLTEIQILGDPTESFEQFLELSLVYPRNESGIARKTGAWIKCRGLAFIFVQGFLWTVEFKDNKTEPDILPKFSISESKVEFSSDGRKYLSSWLTILPDNRTLSSVVNVTCSAFVNDRDFSVQSNLTFKLEGYNSNVEPVVKFPVGVFLKCENITVQLSPEKRQKWYLYHKCDLEPIGRLDSSNQSLKRTEVDLQGSDFLETNAENLACAVTLPNGTEHTHNLTRNQCKTFVKDNNCTEKLDRSTTTKKAQSTPKTTTEISTVASSSSGTASTDSTATATTTNFATTTESATTSTDSPANEESTKVDAPNSLTVGLIVVAVIFPLAFIILVYKHFQTRKELRLLTANEIDEFVKGDPGKLKDVEIQGENVHLLPFNKKYEVSDSDYSIDHSKILGSGEFGTVYGGTLRQIPVAIKTTKSETDVEIFKAFLKEIKVMTFIGEHENVVQLLGTVTNRIRERVVFIIVELASHGSLHSFLREHQNNFVNSLSSSRLLQISPDQINSNEYANTSTNGQLPITTLDLVKWCGQIASGMAHLASKKIIHGDLAARNILLFDDYTAKITDFGLARQLYTSTNYVKKQQSPLPWRIMAPESLKNLQFSTKSDVWAFGVLAWEIFSLAAVPYSGLTFTQEFLEQLEHELRLQKPKWATNDIYESMCSCWHPVANCRPDFEHLEKFYKEMLQQPANGSETIYLQML